MEMTLARPKTRVTYKFGKLPFHAVADVSSDDIELAKQTVVLMRPNAIIIDAKPLAQTAAEQDLVIFSHSKFLGNNRAGFWSERAGWVRFDDATRISNSTGHQSTKTEPMPVDVCWVVHKEAATYLNAVARQHVTVTLVLNLEFEQQGCNPKHLTDRLISAAYQRIEAGMLKTYGDEVLTEFTVKAQAPVADPLLPEVTGMAYDDPSFEAITFNAATWLAQASNEEIKNLVQTGFHKTAAVMAIAEFVGLRNQELGQLLASAKAGAASESSLGPVACLDSTQVMQWVQAHRAGLWPEMLCIQHGVRLGSEQVETGDFWYWSLPDLSFKSQYLTSQEAAIGDAIRTLGLITPSVSIESLLQTSTDSQLDALLMQAAHEFGYFGRIDVQWHIPHYGKHAEIARQAGLTPLAHLFSAAWSIQHQLHAERVDQAERARNGLRVVFADQLR